MATYTVTDEKFIEIVKTSQSIAQVIRSVGLIPAGQNYTTMNKRIKRLDIDTSHFTGMLWSKGKIIGPKRPLEDYLSNKFPIGSHKLKLRLIRECVMVAQCRKCKNKEWNGFPIPLELEHINGNHDDNTLSNLELLCPNCHAQTNTYCGRNKESFKNRPKVSHRYVRPLTNTCIDCGDLILKRNKRCRKCNSHVRKTKIVWPDETEIIAMLQTETLSSLGKKLGVCGNAIKKHLEKSRSVGT